VAKRTRKTTVKEPVTGDSINRDAVFDQLITDVQTKMQKKGMLVGHDPVLTVLPVPAFIIRYLLRNTGLPMSCIYQVVGPQGCYKSTFAMEILRWHRLCGGFGQLCEAETKAADEMRPAVLNWDMKAVSVEDCATFEDWQRKTLLTTAQFQKACEKAGGPGRTIPFCNVVDSLTGKASEQTLKKIDEHGHATMHFASEARQMADFMRAYPQKLLGWPITFVGVNHMKIAKDAITGVIDYNIPGGWSLKFQCAGIIEMDRIGKIQEYANYKAALVKFNTIKNSYGEDSVRINVRFKTWHQEDAPGVWRLHSRFEWWEAGIQFLATGQGLTQAKAKVLVPKMREVCDIHEKSGGSAGKLYWSNRLGVASSDAMPAHDLGMRLEQRPDVLTDLYNLLDITQQPYFKPGVDYLQQQEGYEHVLEQANAAEAASAAMRKLQEEQAALGPTTEEYPMPVNEPATEWPDPSGDAPEEIG
jgi:hypothetical protein